MVDVKNKLFHVIGIGEKFSCNIIIQKKKLFLILRQRKSLPQEKLQSLLASIQKEDSFPAHIHSKARNRGLRQDFNNEQLTSACKPQPDQRVQAIMPYRRGFQSTAQ